MTLSSFLWKKKNKQDSVKLANFIYRNKYTPIMVKLKVVKACINSSLTYACETWGNCPLNSVEVLQRTALKLILNVYNNTPNEIVYIESGFTPLKPTIYKRQLNLFRKMKNDATRNPLSTISRFFIDIIHKKLPYIKHYMNLDEKFENAFHCYTFYENEQKTLFAEKNRGKEQRDRDSILGTYCRLNPALQTPAMYHQMLCTESDRNILTKYRTGSHSQQIHTGRNNNEDRRERLCFVQ